jgi:hypothetical protein
MPLSDYSIGEKAAQAASPAIDGALRSRGVGALALRREVLVPAAGLLIVREELLNRENPVTLPPVNLKVNERKLHHYFA